MNILNIFLISSTLFISSICSAQDIEMDTVKKMYQESKNNDHPDILVKYADPHLRAILKKADQVFSDTGLVCGYDYDVLWMSQDPEYHRQISFKKLKDHQVQVTLAKTERSGLVTIIYQLNCQANRCKVSDVLDNGKSLKQKVFRECR